MLVSWNDHFALGIGTFDSGHALVIEAVNQLNEAATATDGERVAAHMLPLLRTALTAQFEVEARLLAPVPFQARATHEAEHRRVLDVLATLDRDHARGAEIAGILLLNLVCFLVSHLRGTDADTYAALRFRAAA